ncbi:unnamed protein product [Phytophthora fragariaefolia]|uniref:Unnamed protein product n=1 Tax=Phytophthora fragariaefolia TaxID=1490495 RepID=A0A9W6WXI2_9STRA|nr:unnamed protein product [Phytophthora fragariaefolia]
MAVPDRERLSNQQHPDRRHKATTSRNREVGNGEACLRLVPALVIDDSKREHTWGIFHEHVLQHFEASNYQAVLREKLHRLKQTADIETCNGEYSALIFRVEGMSVIDQVLYYANGLKPRTRSYVKLENPPTLSDAMDLAVKYEVTHFVEEVRDQQPRRDKKFSSAGRHQAQSKPFRGKPFHGKGRFKPSVEPKRAEGRTCFHCKKPGHIKANCFLWKKEQVKLETVNHVSEGGSCRGRERYQNTKV